MKRVMMWKELRDQGVLWCVVAVLSAAALFGWNRLMLYLQIGVDPESTRAGCIAVTIVLMGLYGLVCGAMLLAGERENGTLDFLDTLTGSRRLLWRLKVGAGLVLVLALAALQSIMLIAAGSSEAIPASLSLCLLLLAGFSQFAAALAFSASGKVVLYVIGKTLVCEALCGSLFLAAARLDQPSSLPPLLLLVFIFLVVATVVLLIVSVRAFATREPGAWSIAAGETARDKPSSLAVLAWLSWRQSRGLALSLGLLAIGLGGLVPFAAAAVWPIGTLFIGVLCGVAIFLDENRTGAVRLVGDQRFHPVRFWAMKLAIHAVLAIVLLGTFGLIPLLYLFSRFDKFQNPQPLLDLLQEIEPPKRIRWIRDLLFIWIVYGFCAGQLCGLLVRRGLTAIFFGLIASGCLAGLWLPSLLAGGVHSWQVWGTPALLVLAAITLLHPWAAEQVSSKRAFGRVALMTTAFVAFLAGALAYRVVEIPNVPPPAGLEEFLAGLADQPKGADSAFELIHQARPPFLKLEGGWWSATAQKSTTGELQSSSLIEALDKFLDEPRASLDATSASAIDEFFTVPAIQDLHKLREKPPATLMDPREIMFRSNIGIVDGIRGLSRLFVARGLQLLSRDDPRGFVQHFAVALSLTRNCRHNGALWAIAVAHGADLAALRGLDRWLERLDGNAELMREVQELLRSHEMEALGEIPNAILTEYLVWRNHLEEPFPYLLDSRRSLLGWEAAVIGLSRRVPWEVERRDRALRATFEGDADQIRQARAASANFIGWSDNHRERFIQGNRLFEAAIRAAQIKLALRRYQADKGKLPAKLEDLVPTHLAEMPRDPFDGAPFRYRVSTGEKVTMISVDRQPVEQLVPAGQGILWSVGPDQLDNGGTDDLGSQQIAGDLLFLVPPPAKTEGKRRVP